MIVSLIMISLCVIFLHLCLSDRKGMQPVKSGVSIPESFALEKLILAAAAAAAAACVAAVVNDE